MAEQFGEKVHDASPYRLEEARKKGNVPKSQDLGSAIILVLATAMMLWLGEYSLSEVGPYFEQQLGGEPWVHASASDVLNAWVKGMWVMAWVTLPICFVLFIAAVLANVMQTGLMFLPDKLQMDFKRIDPIKGLGRLVSLQSTARLGFGFFKITIVFLVAVWIFWGEWETVLALSSFSLREIAVYIVRTTLWFAFQVGVALLILAILDYAFQSWKTAQDLRMTDQEMREEVKHLDGDPKIKQRRRQVQRQLTNARMASGVPQADVAITNPTELAIAIKYDPLTMAAPIVVAKGAGTMAQRIRRLCLEHSIPIVERKELAQALYRDVEINQEIPVDQYNAVAEVLRYIYQLQGKEVPSLPGAA